MGTKQEQYLFLGAVIDGQLQRVLDRTTGRAMRRYFTDERYLKVVECKGNRYIGKVLHDGFPYPQIDDVVRNIHSIITKLDPARRVKAKDVRLYSLDLGSGPDQVATD